MKIIVVQFVGILLLKKINYAELVTVALAVASAVDLARAKGETISRQWEQSKVATLFGVAQQEKAAADQARQRALNQQIAAYGMIAGGVTEGIGAAQDDAGKLLTMGQ